MMTEQTGVTRQLQRHSAKSGPISREEGTSRTSTNMAAALLQPASRGRSSTPRFFFS